MKASDPIQAEQAINLVSSLAISVKLNSDAIKALAAGDTANAQRLNALAATELQEWILQAKAIASDYGYEESNG